MLRCVAALALLSVCFGCQSETEATKKKVADLTEQANRAAEATKKLADDAKRTSDQVVDGTKKAVDATKSAADKGKAMLDSANAAWDDVPDTGELSETAKGWLAEAGKNESIEAAIRQGTQIAPVALEIGRTVSDAIDSETKIEPIFQKVADDETEDVDAAISAMPRTEVIDGLTLGFKQLDETTNAELVKERGYLITWREGDRLYGFVYRSKRTIDLDKLVAQAPRLLKLTKSVVDAD